MDRPVGLISEGDHLIVSEPFSDLPGLWHEIPEATAVSVPVVARWNNVRSCRYSKRPAVAPALSA